MDYNMDITEDLKHTECSHTAIVSATHLGSTAEVIKCFLSALRKSYEQHQSKNNKDRMQEISEMIEETESIISELQEFEESMVATSEFCFQKRI